MARDVEPLRSRDPDRRRDLAWRAVEHHARIYVLGNAFLVAIWFVTGAGAFWPVWPLLGWGLGLAVHASTTFGSRPR